MSLVAAFGLVMIAMTTGAAAGAAKAATHKVTIEGTKFDAADLTVNAGDSIVWENKDPYPHTATSKTGGFDSKDIASEKSWKYVAKKKGDFPYVCTIHPSMKGTIHVK
ncbi:MAG TPA: cupredoxin family copper-binding protein [Vicinamibacterales bacterium]|nr:cupredoxin family copper-binding protein [Vicinamibacterales bacterium]